MLRKVVAAISIAASSAAYGAQSLSPKVSPDGQWRLEIADYTSVSKFELWATPAAGGVRRKIGHPVPSDHDVFEFIISADSSRVVYRQGRTATGESKLYSTQIDRATGALISQPLPPLGRVDHGIALALGGTHARYRWAADPGSAGGYYAVPVQGGKILAELFRDGFENGTTGGWR